MTSKTKIDLRISQFPKEYWKYLLVTCLFGLGNSSNAFLILEIREKGFSLLNTILVYSLYNLIAALISYPAGSLSDKFGRKPILLISFSVFFITDAGFAFSTDVLLIGFLFGVLWPVPGNIQDFRKIFCFRFVPQHLRASGIGWYLTVVGLSGLIASIIAGKLWDAVSHDSVFIYGAAISLMGIILLIILVPNSVHKKE